MRLENAGWGIGLRVAAVAIGAFGVAALVPACGSDSSGGSVGGSAGVAGAAGAFGGSGGVGATGGTGGGTGGVGGGTGGVGGGQGCGNLTDCGNGVCADTKNDPANCGTCGNACGAGQVCSNGTCGINCGGGTIECGGKCVDTTVDEANCGACGTACQAGEVCSNSTCGSSCGSGLTNCAGSCVNTQNDTNNCGACGTACNTAGGEVCAQGTCSVNCTGGLTKCGTACTNTANDPANCGTCGNQCPAGQLCSAGSCIGQCPTGQSLCSNKCVNILTDTTNCGTCGTTCTTGQQCLNGTCTTCDSTTQDCDGDGWNGTEGDCCDKAGFCGADPGLVNPGAFEVVGNGIDDNCNNKVDLFDTEDTLACDQGLPSNSAVAGDYAKAIDICRTTTETPANKKDKTWGLIDSKIMKADGTALAYANAKSIRPKFGTNINPTEGSSLAVLSSGIASDGVQTNPGPNGGAPTGFNVSTSHSSTANIQSCADPLCIDDWYTVANPPLKNANQYPAAPNCGSPAGGTANDSVCLYVKVRAPTNARAFSFNSFFFSSEYPEYVCTSFNDQWVAIVDTPTGPTSPIPNPVDKNLLTYIQGTQKWPVGINIAGGTSLFSVCDPAVSQSGSPCYDSSVNPQSCGLGTNFLTGTGFEKPSGSSCVIGGGTFFLTSAGNVNPGEIVTLRLCVFDVGDSILDSLALIDGFKWLTTATIPGTGG